MLEIKIKKSWIKKLHKFDLRNQSYPVVLLQAALVVCIIALFVQGQRMNIAGVNKSIIPTPTQMAIVPTLTPTVTPMPTASPTMTPTNTPTPFPTPTPIQISKDAIEVATKMYVLGGEKLQESIKKETDAKTQDEAITKLAYALTLNPTAYGQMKALVEIYEAVLKNKASQKDNSPAPAPLVVPALPQMHFTNCSVGYLGNINCTTL